MSVGERIKTRKEPGAKNPAALQASAPVFAYTPVDVIAAIVGGDAVKLGGYTQDPMPQSWVRPGIKFIDARDYSSAADAAKLIFKREETIRRYQYFAGVCLVVSGFLIGMIVSALLLPKPTEPQVERFAVHSQNGAPIAWRVEAVEVSGVKLLSNGGDGKSVVRRIVGMGERLPNGEVLKSVDVAVKEYTTDVAVHRLLAAELSAGVTIEPEHGNAVTGPALVANASNAQNAPSSVRSSSPEIIAQAPKANGVVINMPPVRSQSGLVSVP